MQPAEFVETNFLSSLLIMLETSSYIAVLPPFVRSILSPSIRTEAILNPPLDVEFVAAYDPSSPNPGTKYFADSCMQTFT